MRGRKCSLGLDLGTSGVKAVLLASDGTVLAMATRTYVFDSPHAGWAEIDPVVWEQSARLAVRAALLQVPDADIVGVGLDGQMHGVVFVDEGGEPVRPAVLWPDSRATEQAARWQSLSTDSRSSLANPIVPGMAGPIIGWVSEHEPDKMAATSTVLMAKDWLRTRLIAGKGSDHTSDGSVTDASDASATLLWNVIEDTWEPSAVHATGLPPEKLPKVRPSGSLAGTVSRTAAERWGLPEGIPVAIGCADVAATLLGLGAQSGVVTLIFGTGAQLLVPGIQPRATAVPRYHTYRGEDDSYYAMAAVTNAGLVFHRSVDLLGATWSELYGAASTPATASTPFFLPYLTGERFISTASADHASWIGLGLGTSRQDLLYATLEGVAFSLRTALASLPVSNPRAISITGGGTRDPGYMQLLANVLARPLHRVGRENPTVVGAALLGFRVAEVLTADIDSNGGDVFDPVEHAILDERFERFETLTAAITA